ncbi:hypothetical protein JTB14_021911 [Gonioctena quinquepunctata]|nr:hypothetical protein JTB14_021911 [Gonioctena quinquepunctata]
MDTTFKCCREKGCSNVCCIQCFSIIHYSCLERKKYIQFIEAHKVICSKECATKKKEEDEKLQKITNKIEELLTITKEKDMEIQKRELEHDLKRKKLRKRLLGYKKKIRREIIL